MQNNPTRLEGAPEETCLRARTMKKGTGVMNDITIGISLRAVWNCGTGATWEGSLTEWHALIAIPAMPLYIASKAVCLLCLDLYVSFIT